MSDMFIEDLTVFEQQALGTLQTVINKAIASDSNTAEKLNALPHHAVALHITTPAVKIIFEWANEQYYLHQEYAGPIGADIYCSLSGLSHLALNPDKASSLPASQFRMTGDADLAQSLQRILTNYHIDWEAHLAGLVGDSLARTISYHSQQLWDWQKNVFNTFCQDTSEFVQHEVKLTPSKNALEDFFDDVSILRHDVARLEARIQQLRHAHD